MREERVHVGFSDFLRVTLSVKNNESPYPSGVGVLGAVIVMAEAYLPATCP
jgi:hypothetical protein